MQARLKSARLPDLTTSEAKTLCSEMLSGSMSENAVANRLVELAEKGETAEEVSGFVSCLLERAESVPSALPTMDTCGTGGSGLVRFNVSTFVAFVLAADGIRVAKHGNRGSRRPNGSFDLLDALEVPITLTGDAVADCLESVGLAFLYARRFHPAMTLVANARALAARRTIFNLAAPLSNPTLVTSQVVGCTDVETATVLTKCLQLLGRKRSTVVTSTSGIDDVDISGPSILHAVHKGRAETLNPAELGISIVRHEKLPGGDAETNALLFRQLLADAAPRPLRDLVCLSAAVAFYTHSPETSVPRGFQKASELLRSGAVSDTFSRYRDLAKQLAVS